MAEGTPVEILVRPDDVVLCEDMVGGIEVTICKKLFNGSASLYTLELPTGSKIEALLTSHHDFALGETLNIQTDLEHLIAFQRDH